MRTEAVALGRGVALGFGERRVLLTTRTDGAGLRLLELPPAAKPPAGRWQRLVGLQVDGVARLIALRRGADAASRADAWWATAGVVAAWVWLWPAAPLAAWGIAIALSPAGLEVAWGGRRAALAALLALGLRVAPAALSRRQAAWHTLEHALLSSVASAGRAAVVDRCGTPLALGGALAAAGLTTVVGSALAAPTLPLVIVALLAVDGAGGALGAWLVAKLPLSGATQGIGALAPDTTALARAAEAQALLLNAGLGHHVGGSTAEVAARPSAVYTAAPTGQRGPASR